MVLDNKIIEKALKRKSDLVEYTAKLDERKNRIVEIAEIVKSENVMDYKELIDLKNESAFLESLIKSPPRDFIIPTDKENSEIELWIAYINKIDKEKDDKILESILPKLEKILESLTKEHYQRIADKEIIKTELEQWMPFISKQKGWGYIGTVVPVNELRNEHATLYRSCAELQRTLSIMYSMLGKEYTVEKVSIR